MNKKETFITMANRYGIEGIDEDGVSVREFLDRYHDCSLHFDFTPDWNFLALCWAYTPGYSRADLIGVTRPNERLRDFGYNRIYYDLK